MGHAVDAGERVDPRDGRRRRDVRLWDIRRAWFLP